MREAAVASLAIIPDDLRYSLTTRPARLLPHRRDVLGDPVRRPVEQSRRRRPRGVSALGDSRRPGIRQGPECSAAAAGTHQTHRRPARRHQVAAEEMTGLKGTGTLFFIPPKSLVPTLQVRGNETAWLFRWRLSAVGRRQEGLGVGLEVPAVLVGQRLPGLAAVDAAGEFRRRVARTIEYAVDQAHLARHGPVDRFPRQAIRGLHHLGPFDFASVG